MARLVCAGTFFRKQLKARWEGGRREIEKKGKVMPIESN